MKKCHEIILKKYPDKIKSIWKKQNTTIKVENQEKFYENTNLETNYLNEAICKMSKNLFFDHKISYCSNNDVKK